MGLGMYGGKMPMRLGEGDTVLRDEHRSLRDAMAKKGFPVDDETEMFAELYADAVGVWIIWRASERVSNQFNGELMQEMLPIWAQATNTLVLPGDTRLQIARRVAAKQRGIPKNATVDLEDSAKKVANLNFKEGKTIPEDQTITYWPGVNPGPPGFEWASDRAHFAAVLNTNSIDQQSLEKLVRVVFEQLDSMAAAWATISVGTPGPFNVGVSQLGTTLL